MTGTCREHEKRVDVMGKDDPMKRPDAKQVGWPGIRGILSRPSLKGDLLGGLTASVVSLPLALAFGAMSGAGAQAGLYGAVMVGFWAAVCGGTSTLISGPTGPMTVVMAAIFTRLAASHPEHALVLGFTAVVIAGILQILLGALRLGRYITLMPYSVISGFMSGIGVLLILHHLPGLLGHPTTRGGTLAVLRSLPDLVANMQPLEVLLGTASLAVLILQPVSWKKRVPAPLVVLLLGLLCGWLVFPEGTLRRIGVIPTGLPQFHMPVFTPDLVLVVLKDGLILGVLGSIDTLLTALITDSLTRSQHRSDRELVGQGIGNIFSGLFGGLPGAGATLGTIVNIQCGAQTRLSGVVRALVLLSVALAIAPLLRNVPMVVLAAITIKVGIDILDWSFLRRAHKVSFSAALIMYSVLLLAVTIDIIVAVGIGLFVANILTMERLSRLQSANVNTIDPASNCPLPMSAAEKELFERGGGRILLFHLSGPMIFGVASAIAREREAIKEADVLIIDLGDVPMLTTTVGLAMENVICDAQATGCAVIVAGADPKIRERLERLGLVGNGGAAYNDETRLAALERASSLLRRGKPSMQAPFRMLSKAGRG